MLLQRHVIHVEGDGMFMERHVIWGEHVMFKEGHGFSRAEKPRTTRASAPEAMLLVFPFLKPSLDITRTSLYSTSLIKTSPERKDNN